MPWNWKIKIEMIGLFWLELFSQVILGILGVITGLGLVIWLVVVWGWGWVLGCGLGCRLGCRLGYGLVWVLGLGFILGLGFDLGFLGSDFALGGNTQGGA